MCCAVMLNIILRGRQLHSWKMVNGKARVSPSRNWTAAHAPLLFSCSSRKCRGKGRSCCCLQGLNSSLLSGDVYTPVSLLFQLFQSTSKVHAEARLGFGLSLPMLSRRWPLLHLK